MRTALIGTLAGLLAAVGLFAESPPSQTPGTGPGATEERGDFPYQWIEVADGVYAALQPDGNRFNDSNSVVIVVETDVVVVDTQNYPATNRALIDRIRQVTDQPVRYVVNTHWHGDHTQGNSVYKAQFPQAKIIGHPTLNADIPERAAPQLEEQMDAYRKAIPEAQERLARGISSSGEELDEEGRATLARQVGDARARLAEMEAVEFTTPDLVVEDRLTLESGERKIEIRHFRAHTRGDLVVFLPDEKVLVTGDLLDDLPYGGHGYPKEWVAALDELAALDFEILIPGHGRIRQGKSHLKQVREMFAAIVAKAEAAHRAGSSLEVLQSSIDLEPFRRALAGDDPIANQAFDQFVPPAVERAWLEVRGELED